MRYASHDRVHHNRAPHLLVLLFLLSASLSTGVTQTAGAQPLCLDGKIWDEDVGECVDIEEDVPVDVEPTEVMDQADEDGDEADQEDEAENGDAGEGTAEAGEGEDEDPALRADKDKGTATINLYARACPTDFDATSVDESIRQATCADFAEGVGYALRVVDVSLDIATSPGNGAPAQFDEVPINQEVIIAHMDSLGFSGPAVVHCSNSADASSPEHEYTFSSNGGSFSIPDLNANDVWNCTSYFTPLITGEITAHVFDCPAGLDIQVTEPDLLHTNCEPHLTNLQFELDLDGLISNSSTNTLGRTTYRSVPPGQYRLRIVLPEGSDSPVVFCQVRGPSGQTLENYDRFDVSNAGSIGLGMDSMDYAACDFFLSGDGPADLAAGSQQEVPSPTPTSTPKIIADAAVIDDAVEAEILVDPTPTLVDSIVDIDKVKDAEILVESTPTPTPRVFGEIADVDSIVDAELTEATPGEVTIVKQVCPAGFDAYNASAIDINVYCEYDKTAIFEFNLTDGFGGYQIQHTELNYPLAEFEGVAPGAISIMESVPPGFGEPVVYCQTIPDSGEPTPYTEFPVVNENTLQINLPAGGWLACDWFNVPVGAGMEPSPSSTGFGLRVAANRHDLEFLAS
jgi:hypothetical protein